MKIEVTVCDVDQEVGETTTRYQIQRNGETVSMDLCGAHAAPIEALIAPMSQPAKREAPARKTAAKKAAKKTSAPRRRSAKVMSIDEIEASKKR